MALWGLFCFLLALRQAPMEILQHGGQGDLLHGLPDGLLNLDEAFAVREGVDHGVAEREAEFVGDALCQLGMCSSADDFHMLLMGEVCAVYS